MSDVGKSPAKYEQSQVSEGKCYGPPGRLYPERVEEYPPVNSCLLRISKLEEGVSHWSVWPLDSLGARSIANWRIIW